MIILHFHLQTQFKNELFHILYIVNHFVGPLFVQVQWSLVLLV